MNKEEKLRLNEILEVDNRDILEKANNDNIFIISPVGCGKSYFAINNLCSRVNKALILVDNNGLKEGMMKEYEQITTSLRWHYKQVINSNNEIEYIWKQYQELKNPITIMTYSEFGSLIRWDRKNKLINSYDLIIADEIHDLIKYQEFDDSTDLLVAFLKLVEKYEHTKIVWMTATPYYIQVLEERNRDLSENFIFYDYTDDSRIFRYVENSIEYLSHMNAIVDKLKNHNGYFKYNNGKVLIGTQKISTMRDIEELIKDFDFIKSISLWSNREDTQKKYPFTDEQIRVRKHLLEKHELVEPYNCLLINSAYETGINIHDKDINLLICHTTNPTQQIQFRGRVRHDIDLLVFRTNEKEKILNNVEINIPNDMLNKWLSKEQLQNYLDSLNIPTDEKQQKFTVNSFVNKANKYGYTVEKKYGKKKGQKTKYFINKL